MNNVILNDAHYVLRVMKHLVLRQLLLNFKGKNITTNGKYHKKFTLFISFDKNL